MEPISAVRRGSGPYLLGLLFVCLSFVMGALTVGAGSKASAQTVSPGASPAILIGYNFLAGPNPGTTPQPNWMIGLGTTSAAGSSNANLGPPMPSAGILKNLTAVAVGNISVPVTVYINDSPSSLSCMTTQTAPPLSASSCTDTMHQVQVKAGDIVGVAVVLRPGQDGGTDWRVSLEKQ